MKNLGRLAILSMIAAVSFNKLEAADQTAPVIMAHGHHHGMGMGMGRGMGMGGWPDIPESLAKPKNAEWIKKLTDVLAIERETYAQYKADYAKYRLRMPYRRIIHQESMHIQIIEDLFDAYGMKTEDKPEKIIDTKSLNEALENAIKSEQVLINDYVWLVKNVEDQSAADALNRILMQTRWHLAMFQQLHAMGGKTMGPGMMMMD